MNLHRDQYYSSQPQLRAEEAPTKARIRVVFGGLWGVWLEVDSAFTILRVGLRLEDPVVF